MVGIIDYGAGNIRSIKNAILRIGEQENIKVIVSENVEVLSGCKKIILPGVGAFGDVMKNIKEKKLDRFVKEWIGHNNPFLGICIGLQILFEVGYEMGTYEGLGILKGEVKKFQKLDIIIPHIGWNQIIVRKDSPYLREKDNGKYFYFVHSYYAKPKNPEIINTTTNYDGEEFTSSIFVDNVFAVQFHPEKSHKNGEEIIKRFLKI